MCQSAFSRIDVFQIVCDKIKGDHLIKKIRYTDENKKSAAGGRRWSRWKKKKANSVNPVRILAQG